MTASKTIGSTTFFVALSSLDESERNVRRTGRSQGIEELAALIDAQGLLQPLGVTATLDADGQPSGRYAVEFGGRRLAALNLLRQRKRLTKAATVACQLVDPVRAVEASLTENVGRVAMHPADEFEAFAALHDGGTGLPVEQIALRFGTSAAVVRQRLRLASVSPALLAAFRAGSLALDQVMAFAVTTDHAAQEQVFATLPEWQRRPHGIRQALTEGEVEASDRRVRFVGVEAYEAAGGAIRRDLFSEDNGGWIEDPLLLDRLVSEKLAERAATVQAEGWAWVEGIRVLPEDYHHLRRLRPVTVALSEDDAARLAAVEARMGELEAEAGSEDLTTEQAAELEKLGAEHDDLTARQTAFRPADVARAGAFVMLTHDGVRIERGFLRGDTEQPAGAGVANDDEATEDGEADADHDEAGKKAPTLAAPLVAELAAHRTVALQAEVATRPHLALCVLIESLATAWTSACSVRVASPPRNAACADIEEIASRQHLAATADQMPEGDALLPWLIQQDTATLLALLAPMVARGIDSGSADWTTARAANCAPVRLARLAELDMRGWWRADAASYFGRVSKAMILDAVREGVGAPVAHRMEGLKKAPMADAATQALAGTGWLPPMMRTPAVEAEAQPLALAAE